MIELIKEYKIQSVIIIIITIGLTVGLFVFVNSFVESDVTDNSEVPETEEEGYSEMEENENIETEEDTALLEIGEVLYEDAENIYSMNPYCGINYEEITEFLIEEINGVEYYLSPYSSVDEIYDRISEVLVTNPIKINNTIMKDGYVYCRYNPPKKSSTYLNTYLKIVSFDETHINYMAISQYIKKKHSEDCSIDTPIQCMDEDVQKEKNSFKIEMIDGVWKVKEFHLYH